MVDIITKIEVLRLELNKLGEEKGIGDPEVIELSQKLDELILQYYSKKNEDSI